VSGYRLVQAKIDIRVESSREKRSVRQIKKTPSDKKFGFGGCGDHRMRGFEMSTSRTTQDRQSAQTRCELDKVGRSLCLINVDSFGRT